MQRLKSHRPFIAVPMPTQAGRSINPETPLAVGSRVRIVRGQHAGVSGTVTDLFTNLMQLATGARVQGVAVDVGGNEPVLVPIVNLDRLL
jgi:hypothetical protein